MVDVLISHRVRLEKIFEAFVDEYRAKPTRSPNVLNQVWETDDVKIIYSAATMSLAVIFEPESDNPAYMYLIVSPAQSREQLRTLILGEVPMRQYAAIARVDRRFGNVIQDALATCGERFAAGQVENENAAFEAGKGRIYGS